MPFIYLSAVIFSTFLLFISLFYLACLKIYNNNKEWKFEFETDTRFPLVLHNCSRNIKITKTNVKMWKLKDKATDRTQDKEVPIVICRERERERESYFTPSFLRLPWAPPHSPLRRHEPLSSSLLKHLPFTENKPAFWWVRRQILEPIRGGSREWIFVFLMGKNSDEEQSLPENNEGSRCSSSSCCSARISRCFSLRCVLILAFSAAVFLSAVFWLPPFLGLSDRDDLDLDPRFKGIYIKIKPFDLHLGELSHKARIFFSVTWQPFDEFF